MFHIFFPDSKQKQDIYLVNEEEWLIARGAEAKNYVENKIREIFGKDFVGVDPSTKKIYVNGYENGEAIQISLTLTCPKVPFIVPGAETEFKIDGNFGEPDIF